MSAENLLGIQDLTDVRMETMGIEDPFPASTTSISAFGVNRGHAHLRHISNQISRRICASCPLNSPAGLQIGETRFSCSSITFGQNVDGWTSSHPFAHVYSSELMTEADWRKLCSNKTLACQPRATFTSEDYKQK